MNSPMAVSYVLDTDLLEQALTATERKAGALNGLVSGENRIPNLGMEQLI
ncbi:MAG: hypothetical protein R2683_00065 [Bifidobacterium adolescentis]